MACAPAINATHCKLCIHLLLILPFALFGARVTFLSILALHADGRFCLTPSLWIRTPGLLFLALFVRILLLVCRSVRIATMTLAVRAIPTSASEGLSRLIVGVIHGPALASIPNVVSPRIHVPLLRRLLPSLDHDRRAPGLGPIEGSVILIILYAVPHLLSVRLAVSPDRRIPPQPFVSPIGQACERRRVVPRSVVWEEVVEAG